MKRKKGVALSTSGKVLLSFQQNRKNEDQLDGEDLAAFVRTMNEVTQAEKNRNALLQYLSTKYALEASDIVGMDGSIVRKSREAPKQGGPASTGKD